MRQEVRLNKCVGITKDGELIMVDYLFNDTLHDSPFHGATGTRFAPLTQKQIDERNEIDNVKDNYGFLWKEAVANDLTEMSYDDYIQELIDCDQAKGDGLFLGHDTSSIYYIPDAIKAKFQDCVAFECIGGGRMFPLREEMAEIFDQDLFESISMIEAEPYDLEMFSDVLGAELKVRE